MKIVCGRRGLRARRIERRETKRAEEYCDGEGDGGRVNEQRDERWFGYHGLIKESVTAGE